MTALETRTVALTDDARDFIVELLGDYRDSLRIHAENMQRAGNESAEQIAREDSAYASELITAIRSAAP